MPISRYPRRSQDGSQDGSPTSPTTLSSPLRALFFDRTAAGARNPADSAAENDDDIYSSPPPAFPHQPPPLNPSDSDPTPDEDRLPSYNEAILPPSATGSSPAQPPSYWSPSLHWLRPTNDLAEERQRAETRRRMAAMQEQRERQRAIQIVEARLEADRRAQRAEMGLEEEGEEDHRADNEGSGGESGNGSGDGGQGDGDGIRRRDSVISALKGVKKTWSKGVMEGRGLKWA